MTAQGGDVFWRRQTDESRCRGTARCAAIDPGDDPLTPSRVLIRYRALQNAPNFLQLMTLHFGAISRMRKPLPSKLLGALIK